MLHVAYRKRGRFIGSGVVEAACRTVVGMRLKQSGMFGSEEGATGVLDFLTLLLSGRFDDFWIDRANAHAARNDVSTLVASGSEQRIGRAPGYGGCKDGE